MKRSNQAAKAEPLSLEIVDSAAPVGVVLADLDPARYVTARVSKIDQATVTAYAERMTEGDTFPPVELFRDEAGLLWIGDGIHRIEAARKNEFNSISARVSHGGQAAALRHAAGANDSHGLRRSHADKRQAVLMLLEDPAFANESSRTIAELAKVSHPFVESVRISTGKVSSSPRTGADGKVRKARKGRRKASKAKAKRGPARNIGKVVSRVLGLLGARERWSEADLAKLTEAFGQWAQPSAEVQS
jgi:hypothetical protein